MHLLPLKMFLKYWLNVHEMWKVFSFSNFIVANKFSVFVVKVTRDIRVNYWTKQFTKYKRILNTNKHNSIVYREIRMYECNMW